MRKPDVLIWGLDNTDNIPYMERWHIIPRNRFFNIYLHHFLKSDYDRALHDHPWWSISFILKGEYKEHTPKGKPKIYRAGNIKLRGAKYTHRIELHKGPCWTLFITGPRVREWGFFCKDGWRHFEEFLKDGKGCD